MSPFSNNFVPTVIQNSKTRDFYGKLLTQSVFRVCFTSPTLNMGYRDYVAGHYPTGVGTVSQGAATTITSSVLPAGRSSFFLGHLFDHFVRTPSLFSLFFLRLQFSILQSFHFKSRNFKDCQWTVDVLKGSPRTVYL